MLLWLIIVAFSFCLLYLIENIYPSCMRLDFKTNISLLKACINMLSISWLWLQYRLYLCLSFANFSQNCHLLIYSWFIWWLVHLIFIRSLISSLLLAKRCWWFWNLFLTCPFKPLVRWCILILDISLNVS